MFDLLALFVVLVAGFCAGVFVDSKAHGALMLLVAELQGLGAKIETAVATAIQHKA